MTYFQLTKEHGEFLDREKFKNIETAIDNFKTAGLIGFGVYKIINLETRKEETIENFE